MTDLDEAIAWEEKLNREHELRDRIEKILHNLVDHVIGFEEAIGEIIEETKR